MTVRQAGAPVSDIELCCAAARGVSRRIGAEFPHDRYRQESTSRYFPGVGTPFQIPRRIPGYFAELLRDDRGGAAGLGLGAGGRTRIDAAIAEFEMILNEDWPVESQRHIQSVSLA